MRHLVWCIAVCLTGLSLGEAAGELSPAASLTIVLGDFAIRPSVATVQSGQPVRLVLANRGQVDHDFEVYGRPRSAPRDWNAYVKGHTYFRNLGEIDVAVLGQDEVEAEAIFKIHVAPGARVTIYFTPRQRGRFEMGGSRPGTL
jgi:uncharacterized cupredoxin-like copper-binding protein